MRKDIQQKRLSLSYIIRSSVLSKEEKAPVVFMLHGFGSNKEDIFSFANDLPQEFAVVAVDAPYEVTYEARAWYFIEFADGFKFDIEQAVGSLHLVDSFITEACELFNFDAQRITLLGFSQGSILSQVLAVTFPHRYKRVIGLSGYLEEKIAPSDFKTKRFDGVKMYISHGMSDQVVPFEWGQKSVETLRACGVTVTFMYYPTAHGVSPQNYYSFRNWLKQNG